MHKYWWDFVDEAEAIVVQSLKNPEIMRFGPGPIGQELAQALCLDLEEGRIRLTSKDEIKG